MAGIPPLVNLTMPPVSVSGNIPPLTLPQGKISILSSQSKEQCKTAFSFLGIAPLPQLPNLNLPPLSLPDGVAPLPSLDSLASTLPTITPLSMPG